MGGACLHLAVVGTRPKKRPEDAINTNCTSQFVEFDFFVLAPASAAVAFFEFLRLEVFIICACFDMHTLAGWIPFWLAEARTVAFVVAMIFVPMKVPLAELPFLREVLGSMGVAIMSDAVTGVMGVLGMETLCLPRGCHLFTMFNATAVAVAVLGEVH